MTADPLRLDLGITSLRGNDAFGEAVAFRRFLQDAAGREPDGAELVIAPAPDKRLKVVAVYDPAHADWAGRVGDASPDVWERARTGKVPVRAGGRPL